LQSAEGCGNYYDRVCVQCGGMSFVSKVCDVTEWNASLYEENKQETAVPSVARPMHCVEVMQIDMLLQ